MKISRLLLTIVLAPVVVFVLTAAFTFTLILTLFTVPTELYKQLDDEMTKEGV